MRAAGTIAFTIVAIVGAIALVDFVSFVSNNAARQSKSIEPHRTPSMATATTTKRMSPAEILENARIESLIPVPPTYQEALPVRVPPRIESIFKIEPPAEASKVKKSSPVISRSELAPAPAQSSVPSQEKNVVAPVGRQLPPTGDLVPRRSRYAIAPFTIKTKDGANYLAKLVNVSNANDQIWIFVRGGQSYETKVPLGTYSIRLAAGSEWYGRNDLFGADTRFFLLRDKGATGQEKTLTLRFRKEGNRILGTSISLEGSANGNLEQQSMTRTEFDAN
ncbi:hypothetical protein XH90_03490 [Bradyrhizobium sp. CCBAU 53338]|nr:hypothetical protein XH90_03490 [Bradyrhizobium sp. CCBAU 53338]